MNIALPSLLDPVFVLGALAIAAALAAVALPQTKWCPVARADSGSRMARKS